MIHISEKDVDQAEFQNHIYQEIFIKHLTNKEEISSSLSLEFEEKLKLKK